MNRDFRFPEPKDRLPALASDRKRRTASMHLQDSENSVGLPPGMEDAMPSARTHPATRHEVAPLIDLSDRAEREPTENGDLVTRR